VIVLSGWVAGWLMMFTSLLSSRPSGWLLTACARIRRAACWCLSRRTRRPGTFREEWSSRDESPRLAARREVQEEIGLSVEPGDLLAVDRISQVGDFTEVVAFLFDGGFWVRPTSLGS